MVKKFINVCFLIILVYDFEQVVIILTHPNGINTIIIILKKQMFNILLSVFNTTHFVKNKRGRVKDNYAKLTDSTETIMETEERNLNNLHYRNR